VCALSPLSVIESESHQNRAITSIRANLIINVNLHARAIGNTNAIKQKMQPGSQAIHMAQFLEIILDIYKDTK
jgi:hypothetical protein